MKIVHCLVLAALALHDRQRADADETNALVYGVRS
jgi:hypothetical protein